MANYLEHRKNIYSQNGEDGVIEQILIEIGISKNGKCCEFGAWDGKHLSNTYKLIKHDNYKALLIEGDENKYKDLLKTVDEHTNNIVPVCSMVTPENIDTILKENNFFDDLDILSIDVDSVDYEIWKATTCRPKLVIIEPCNSIPLWVRKPIYPVNKDGGANPFILKELAIEKGYTYVCTTGNLFFVRNDITIPTQTDVEFPWWLPQDLKETVFYLSNLDNETFTHFLEDLPKYIKGARLPYMQG